MTWSLQNDIENYQVKTQVVKKILQDLPKAVIQKKTRKVNSDHAVAEQHVTTDQTDSGYNQINNMAPNSRQLILSWAGLVVPVVKVQLGVTGPETHHVPRSSSTQDVGGEIEALY